MNRGKMENGVFKDLHKGTEYSGAFDEETQEFHGYGQFTLANGSHYAGDFE